MDNNSSRSIPTYHSVSLEAYLPTRMQDHILLPPPTQQSKSLHPSPMRQSEIIHHQTSNSSDYGTHVLSYETQSSPNPIQRIPIQNLYQNEQGTLTPSISGTRNLSYGGGSRSNTAGDMSSSSNGFGIAAHATSQSIGAPHKQQQQLSSASPDIVSYREMKAVIKKDAQLLRSPSSAFSPEMRRIIEDMKQKQLVTLPDDPTDPISAGSPTQNQQQFQQPQTEESQKTQTEQPSNSMISSLRNNERRCSNSPVTTITSSLRTSQLVSDLNSIQMQVRSDLARRGGTTGIPTAASPCTNSSNQSLTNFHANYYVQSSGNGTTKAAAASPAITNPPINSFGSALQSYYNTSIYNPQSNATTTQVVTASAARITRDKLTQLHATTITAAAAAQTSLSSSSSERVQQRLSHSDVINKIDNREPQKEGNHSQNYSHRNTFDKSPYSINRFQDSCAYSPANNSNIQQLNSQRSSLSSSQRDRNSSLQIHNSSLSQKESLQQSAHFEENHKDSIKMDDRDKRSQSLGFMQQSNAAIPLTEQEITEQRDSDQLIDQNNHDQVIENLTENNNINPNNNNIEVEEEQEEVLSTELNPEQTEEIEINPSASQLDKQLIELRKRNQPSLSQVMEMSSFNQSIMASPANFNNQENQFTFIPQSLLTLTPTNPTPKDNPTIFHPPMASTGPLKIPTVLTNQPIISNNVKIVPVNQPSQKQQENISIQQHPITSQKHPTTLSIIKQEQPRKSEVKQPSLSSLDIIKNNISMFARNLRVLTTKNDTETATTHESLLMHQMRSMPTRPDYENDEDDELKRTLNRDDFGPDGMHSMSSVQDIQLILQEMQEKKKNASLRNIIRPDGKHQEFTSRNPQDVRGRTNNSGQLNKQQPSLTTIPTAIVSPDLHQKQQYLQTNKFHKPQTSFVPQQIKGSPSISNLHTQTRKQPVVASSQTAGAATTATAAPPSAKRAKGKQLISGSTSLKQNWSSSQLCQVQPNNQHFTQFQSIKHSPEKKQSQFEPEPTAIPASRRSPVRIGKTMSEGQLNIVRQQYSSVPHARTMGVMVANEERSTSRSKCQQQQQYMNSMVGQLTIEEGKQQMRSQYYSKDSQSLVNISETNAQQSKTKDLIMLPILQEEQEKETFAEPNYFNNNPIPDTREYYFHIKLPRNAAPVPSSNSNSSSSNPSYLRSTVSSTNSQQTKRSKQKSKIFF